MQHENIQGGQSKEKSENAEKPLNDRDIEQEKAAGKDQPDTAPDEFIAPNADTDLPLDGKGIVNDAVLGGEDHKNLNTEKKQEKKKQ